MTSYDALFNINQQTYLVLQLPFPKDTLERWDRVSMVLHYKDHSQYLIYNETDWVLGLCIRFLANLEAFENQRELCEKGRGTLAKTWHESCRRVALDLPETPEDIAINFQDYRMLACVRANTLWAYKVNNKGLLQVTPYFNHFPTPFTYPPDEEYNAFMETFDEKVVTIEFSLEIIPQWIEQVKEIFTIMNRNFIEACRLSGYEPEPPEFMPDGTPVMTYVPIPERSVKDDIVDIAIVDPCFHHQKTIP